MSLCTARLSPFTPPPISFITVLPSPSQGDGEGICVSRCVCGESTCWDVYSSYNVHINLFTQSHYRDELPPRDKVKVKSLIRAQETIG